MLISLAIIAITFYWLLLETDYLRIRLPSGPVSGLVPPDIEALYENRIKESFPSVLERMDWSTCVSWYGAKQLYFTACNETPVCGRDWLENNTHPIPQVKVDFAGGGVRYQWDIKDCRILKDAITATHARPGNGNGRRHFKKNKQGGPVAPLPAEVH